MNDGAAFGQLEEACYQISQYSDEELFRILGFATVPSNTELDAKLSYLIRKYNGTRMKRFYLDISSYFHILQEGDTTAPAHSDPPPPAVAAGKEGFDLSFNQDMRVSGNSIPDAEMQDNYKSGQTLLANQELEQQGRLPDPTSYTQQLNYTSGKLNPLLKETVQRIISIDSKYRNQKIYPTSCNYSFTLSEPLYNVVSLKLYSLSIPVSYYTIPANIHAANFFYLRSYYPGIDVSPQHLYKISISSGNYSEPITITTAINASFQVIVNENPDVKFENSTNFITYSQTTMRNTLNISIEKQYGNMNYRLKWMDQNESSPVQSFTKNNTIRSFLGFASTSSLAYQFYTIFGKIFLSSRIIQTNPKVGISVSQIRNQQIEIVFSNDVSHTIIIDLSKRIKIMNPSPNDVMNMINSEIVESHPVLCGGGQDVSSGMTIENISVPTDLYTLTQSRWRFQLCFNRTLLAKVLQNTFLPGMTANVVFPYDGYISKLFLMDYKNSLDIMTSEFETPTALYSSASTKPFIYLKCVKGNFGDYGSWYFPGGYNSFNFTFEIDNRNNIINELVLSQINKDITSGYTSAKIFHAYNSSPYYIKNNEAGLFSGNIYSEEFLDSEYVGLNMITIPLGGEGIPSENGICVRGNSIIDGIYFSVGDVNIQKFHSTFDYQSISLEFISSTLSIYDFTAKLNDTLNKITNYTSCYNVIDEIKVNNAHELGLKLQLDNFTKNAKINVQSIQTSDIIPKCMMHLDFSSFYYFTEFGENRDILQVNIQNGEGDSTMVSFNKVPVLKILNNIAKGITYSERNYNTIVEVSIMNTNDDIISNAIFDFLSFVRHSPEYADLQAIDFSSIYALVNMNSTNKSLCSLFTSFLESTNENITVITTISNNDNYFNATITFEIKFDLKFDLSSDFDIYFYDDAIRSGVSCYEYGNFYSILSSLGASNASKTSSWSNTMWSSIYNFPEFPIKGKAPRELRVIESLKPMILPNIIKITNDNRTFGFEAVPNVNGGVYAGGSPFFDPSSPPPYHFINITVPLGDYLVEELVTSINSQFDANPITKGSFLSVYTPFSTFNMNLNHAFDETCYVLDFYDTILFSSCISNNNTIQNVTRDSTLGWLLGFQSCAQYILNPTTNQNKTKNLYIDDISSEKGVQETANVFVYNVGGGIQLTGDVTMSLDIYKYFFILLNDFVLNHLNDGVVTIGYTNNAPSSLQNYGSMYDELDKQCVSYGSSGGDGSSGGATNTGSNTGSSSLTQTEIYNANLILSTQIETERSRIQSDQFVGDIFGIIPLKPGITPGSIYTEFGGSLQLQSRSYFGPVNIRKLSIQLMNDKGQLVDLNGSDWAFSLICEQLYQPYSS
jgi:hypothetical protein